MAGDEVHFAAEGDFAAGRPTVGALADAVAPTLTLAGDQRPAGVEVEAWLSRWRDEQLISNEWPIILAAWECVREGRHRDLIQLDRDITGKMTHLPHAKACVVSGRYLLNRMRPLTDVRSVQRYLLAIESGEARGWHPIVYGMALAVYSIPLRTGLIGYTERFLDRLLDAVRPRGGKAAADLSLDVGMVPARVTEFLVRHGLAGLRIV